MTFPSSPRNLWNACACSWRTAPIASAELQLCSFIVRRLSSKFVPACFSYSLRAVSKSDRSLDSEKGSKDIALKGCSCFVPRFDVATSLPSVGQMHAVCSTISAAARDYHLASKETKCKSPLQTDHGCKTAVS